MRFKENVRIFGLRPEMLLAIMVSQQVYKDLGNYQNFVVTSARDGTHKRGSDHYVGNAIDLRVWGFQEMGIKVFEVADRIRDRLTDEFEVFDEGDHIHIGFDVQTLGAD